MAFITPPSFGTALVIVTGVGGLGGIAWAAIESWLEQARRRTAYEMLEQETVEISKRVTQDGLTVLHAFNLCETVRRVREESGEQSVTYQMNIELPDGRKGTITLSG